MITRELIEYIRKQLALKKPEEEIRSNLASQSWSEADINGAFGMAKAFSPPQPQTPEVRTQEPEPRTQKPEVRIQAPGFKVQVPQAGQSQEFKPQAPQTAQGPEFKVQTPRVSQPLSMDDLTEEEMSQIYGSRQKPPNKKLFFVILTAFLVLLIGGGAAAYFYYFQVPEKIMAKVIDKSSEIKSEEFSGQTDIDFEYSGDLLNMLNQSGGTAGNLASPLSTKVNFSLSIKFNGASDSSDPNQASSFVILSLMNKAGADTLPFVTMEMRNIGKVVYLGLTEISNSDFLKSLSSLEGQWLKIDPEEIRNMAKEMGISEEELAEFDKALETQSLTPEKIAKLSQLVKDINLIKIVDKLPGEKIDGQNAYHYKYEVSKESLKQFVLEANKIMEVEMKPEEQEAFSKAIDGISSLQGEIWIGKKDLFIHKATIDFEINEKMNEGGFSGKFLTTVEMKNFNKAVSVEAPQNTKSLEELMTAVLGSLFGQQDCQTLAGDEKDDCYLDSSILLASSQDCLKIVSFSKRNDCYYGVAKASSNSLICGQITGSGTQGWRDECYRAVAEKTKNSALCQKVVSSDWKNYCYAGATKEASYCDKIIKAATKEKCKTGLLQGSNI